MARKIVRFTVRMEPKGKQQQARRGVIVYKPGMTRLGEDIIRAFAADCAPARPFQGPIILTAEFYFPIAKSWSTRKKAAALHGSFNHTKKPDLSNCLKQLEDALTGMMWVDDSQVWKYGPETHKGFSETPRIEVTIDAHAEPDAPELPEVPSGFESGAHPDAP